MPATTSMDVPRMISGVPFDRKARRREENEWELLSVTRLRIVISNLLETKRYGFSLCGKW